MSKLHRGGRPPKRKTERLNLLFSDTEYQNCQRAAEIRGVSMAEILRDGLERVIRHMKQKGEWEPIGKEAGADDDNGAE